MNRGYGNRLALKAELVEFVEFKGESSYAIALVYAGNYRLSALFEHNSDISVICGKTGSDVAHKDYNVCALDSNLRLKTHLL